MAKGTKVAVGFGIGLALFSLALIAIGDVASYFAGMFGYSTGVQAGSSLAGVGFAIVVVMLVIVGAVVAVWIYGQLRPEPSCSWGY